MPQQQAKKLACDYVVCLPGAAPASWKQAIGVMQMINELSRAQKTVVPINAYSPNVYAVRNGLLRPKPSEFSHRVDQKPWEGLISDYERMIWIDSDNIIDPSHVFQLLSHDVDIVCGWYRQYAGGPINDDNKVACGYWDRGEGYNKTQSLTVRDMIEAQMTDELISVDYAGMGLMIVKKGVFEKLPYPWFDYKTIQWEENGVKCAELDTEDAGFCFAARELGYKIYVDPKVRVIHQKMVDL